MVVSRLLGRAVALCLLAGTTAFDAAAQAANDQSPQRPRIGLVLSGGGARGAAHIGVLKVLEEMHVPIDVIAGTSMGAIIGGAYASGMPISEMQTRMEAIRTADILKDDPPRRDQTIQRKRDDLANFVGPEFGVEGGQVRLPKGAVAGIGLESLLRSLAHQEKDPDFDNLPIPFRAVATDIETGRIHVLASGNLASALRASMSIPGLFAPAELDGRMLVDGGLTRNLPVDIARQMGADVVIAVNLGTPLLARDQVNSVFGVTAQMINILTEQNVRTSLASLLPKDVLISPNLGNFAASDFDHMGDTVVLGEAATRRAAETLRPLAMSAQAYARHRDSQRLVRQASAAPIDEIRFTGLKRVNPHVLRKDLATQTGRPLDTRLLDADLSFIYGRGDFEHVTYHLQEEGGQRILVIDAEEKASDQGYLRFGLGLSSDFSGNAHFQALASYRRSWVNTLGAEWRSDLRFGRVNQLSSEFYQPLDVAQSFFVAPNVDLEQKPFEIFDGSTRIARFSRQTASVGLDAGSLLGRSGELRWGVYRGARSFSLDTGVVSQVGVDKAIAIGGSRLKLTLDTLDNTSFARDGYSLSLNVLASHPALGARDRYTRWDANYLTAFSEGDHTLQLGFRAGGALGRPKLPDYDLFPFGGFMQLSGYRDGQLLGQSVLFGRAVYARRLVDRPLLQGLVGGFSLEAGRVDGPLLPNSPSGLLLASSIFVATDSPIGPVYVGLGHARSGSTALYFYLGAP